MVLTLEERYLAKTKGNLALAWTDTQGIIIEIRGHWGKFGFENVRKGGSVAESMNVLHGMFPFEQLPIPHIYLPLIEYGDQEYMELILSEDEGGVLLIARDVTQSGLLQQEVMQSRNQLSLANAALEMLADDHAQTIAGLRRFHMLFEHEVRNAAQNIYASLELMRRREVGIEANPNYHAAYLSSAALTETINAALKVEKNLPWQAGGKLVPANLVKDLSLEFAPLAAMKGLELKHEVGEHTLAPVRLDPFRLRLILVNLLGNAVKYTTLGSITLRVKLEQQESCDEQGTALIFSVIDTGIGLDKGIFEDLSFQKDLNFIGSSSKSASLGLYICNYLTRSLRGQLRLHSQGGFGTCVELVFSDYRGLLDA